MKCSYKATNGWHCPSEAHEGIMEKEDKPEVTFYCSHHRRVIEAKQTNRLYQIIKGGDK